MVMKSMAAAGRGVVPSIPIWIVAVAAPTFASEPANDTPGGAEVVVAAPAGTTVSRALESRAICAPCDEDADDTDPLIGAFTGAGVRLDADIGYLCCVAPSVRQLRFTGPADTNFDGRRDSNPAVGHGLIGSFSVFVDYWFGDDYLEGPEFPIVFAVGDEVFTRFITPPAGTTEVDVFTASAGAPINCAGSDRDHFVIQGLAPGESYRVRLFGLGGSGVMAAFGPSWEVVDDTFGSEDDIPQILLVADASGRLRLGVTSIFDESFDGLDDLTGCPHALDGDYTLDIRLAAPECAADFDGSGVRNSADITAFLSTWFARLPRADFNADGVINSSDITDFLSAWFTGCNEPTVPIAPGSVAVAFAGRDRLSVSWQDRSDNEDAFIIRVFGPGGMILGQAPVPPNATSAIVPLWQDLDPGVVLTVEVCARNSAGSACHPLVPLVVPEPCPAPSPLTWSFRRPGSVLLSWADNCNLETAYRVARSRNGGSYTNVAVTDANATQTPVTNLQPGQTYRFKVRGRLPEGFTAYSNEVVVPVPNAAPSSPSNLRTANVWSRTIDLRWNDNSSNEAQFRIAMSLNGTDFNNIGTTGPNQTTFRVSNLQPNRSYWFRARAANLAGYSGYTSTIQVTTPDEPPAAPTNLRLVEADPCSLVVRWDDNSNNESAFRVAISRDGVNYDNAAVTDPNVTSVRITGLCPETPHWVQVRAANAVGFSPYSNVIQAATTPLRAPTNLVAARDDSTPQLDVLVTWTLAPGCNDGYRIARSTDQENWNNVGVVGAGVSSFRDTQGLQSGRRYYYKVRAYLNCGGQGWFSEYSNIDSAIPR